jgi:hypothetical protein
VGRRNPFTDTPTRHRRTSAGSLACSIIAGLCLVLLSCCQSGRDTAPVIDARSPRPVTTAIPTVHIASATPAPAIPPSTPASSDAVGPLPASPQPRGTSPVPRVWTGTFRLYTTAADAARSRFDLDSRSVVGPDNNAADIEFYTSVGSMVFDFLKTVNGAKACLFATGVSTLDECLSHFDELEPTMIADYNVAPICILINQGRLALVRFRASDLREGQERVEFTYSVRKTVP